MLATATAKRTSCVWRMYIYINICEYNQLASEPPLTQSEILAEAPVDII